MQDSKGKENANPQTNGQTETNGHTEIIGTIITNGQTESNENMKRNGQTGHTEININSKLNDSIQSYAKVWFLVV